VSGDNADVYVDDREGSVFSLVGLIHRETGITVNVWTREGRFTSDPKGHPDDLVMLGPKLERTVTDGPLDISLPPSSDGLLFDELAGNLVVLQKGDELRLVAMATSTGEITDGEFLKNALAASPGFVVRRFNSLNVRV